MVKKVRRVRTFARTATKSQEKHLISNAKKLREKPFVILPDCTDASCKKYMTKLHKRLERVLNFKDDVHKLEKLANKKGLEAALAGTLSLALSEKAPYLGVVKFPTGDITYAQRGKADKEKLIAVQHFDDPVLRLFGVKDISFKKRLHVYSWDDGFVCTGRTPQPPKKFLDFIIEKLGLKAKNNVVVCPHVNPDKAVKKTIDSKHYLRLYWKSADLTIALCEDCTASTKNTLFKISQYMLEPELADDFNIDVIAEVVKQKDTDISHDVVYTEEYLSGSLTDHELIVKNLKNREETIKQSDEKIFVLDGVSYGSNSTEFIKKLHPSKNEQEALEYFFKDIDEPVIVADVTPNKLLEKYWKRFGKKFIQSILDDKEMAESFYRLDETPSTILKLLYEYKQRQSILAQLPQFTKLPPMAHFADTLARTYKTFGTTKTLQEIKKRPDTSKGRSLSYAFLLALGKGKDSQWKYSKEEIEYGEFLQRYAKQVLNASPKKYAKALQELLTASGTNEKII
jgi:hypothetical protein